MILYEFQIKITRQDGTSNVMMWRNRASSKLNAAVNFGRMHHYDKSVEVDVLTCNVIQ